MDWATAKHKAAERQAPPAPSAIATLFRIARPSQRVARCATYRVDTAMEFRIGYENDGDGFFKTQLFKPSQEEASAEQGRRVAAAFDALAPSKNWR